jgi:hypothetical protein
LARTWLADEWARAGEVDFVRASTIVKGLLTG